MSAASLSEVAGAIIAANRVGLVCHVGPDGDALGSMLGLGIACLSRGKEVWASFGSPHTLPETFSFMPGLDLLVPPGDFPDRLDVMVVLDAGSMDRIGELASAAKEAATVIVLDHHVTNEGFGDLAVVDPGAAATGEIVLSLLDELGWPLTPDIAQCLLTAVVTDTGRYQYANTTPETMRAAARLLEAGADQTLVSRHVYEEAPFGYLRVAAAALARAELDMASGVVSAVVSDDDLEAAGVDWGDIDNLIDTLRLAAEADVAVLAKEHRDGRVKFSLRSRSGTDVGALAKVFGGGGHRLAAGFTVETDTGTVLRKIRAMVGEYR